MPRDSRLFMTFPIDFDEHPKVEGLSDAAFRAFVSMNGYSRRQGLDGRIPAATARRRWKVRALTELVNSHPERPLVLLDGTDYVLRSYADHQLTTADIDDLREKRSAAGSKGGKALASARAIAKQTGSKPIAESEIETDVTKAMESGQVPDRASSGLDPTNALAESVGIRNLDATREVLERAAGQPMSHRGAIELAKGILSKAKTEVRDVDAYLATVCRKSPAEVAQAFFDLDIGGVA